MKKYNNQKLPNGVATRRTRPSLGLLLILSLTALSLGACPGDSESTPAAPATAPNLVFTTPMLSTSSPIAPSTGFTFMVDIMNTGNAASLPTTKYQIYRSTDAAIDPTDTAEGTSATAIPSPAIAINGTKSVTVPLTSPTTPGDHYYGICIVDDICSAGVKLTVTGPNLVFTTPMLSTSSPIALSTDFTFMVDIMNTGNAASLPTTKYQIYRSDDDAMIDNSANTSDTAEGTPTEIGEAIAAGDTKSITVQLMSPTTAGIYYYGICIVDGPCSTGTKLSVAAYLIHIHNAALAEPQSGSADMKVWVSIHPDSPVNALPTGETIVLSISTGAPATGTAATAGTDFTALSANAAVTIGESSDTVRTRKSFTIPILKDNDAETTAETFGITIAKTAATNVKALIVNDTATASIGGEKQSFLHWTPSHPQILGETVTLGGQIAVPNTANNFRTQFVEFLVGTLNALLSDTEVNNEDRLYGGVLLSKLTATPTGRSTDKKLLFGTIAFDTYGAADTGSRLGLSAIYFHSGDSGNVSVFREASTDHATFQYGQAYKNATFLEQSSTAKLSAFAANGADVARVYARAETDVTYTINTNNAFEIDMNTGQIQVADAAQVTTTNSPYTLTVTARDAAGNTDTQIVTVIVQPVAFMNRLRIVSLESSSVSNDDDVTTVSAAAASTVSYSITGGNTDSAFKINSSSGLIEVADAAKVTLANGPFTLTITATAGSDTDTRTVTVTVY